LVQVVAELLEGVVVSITKDTKRFRHDHHIRFEAHRGRR
jgi:hypothetical protein